MAAPGAFGRRRLFCVIVSVVLLLVTCAFVAAIVFAPLYLQLATAGFERYFDVLAREAGVDPPPGSARGRPELTKFGPRIGEADARG